MSRATLKRSLGEAGAFFDDSHGDDNLLAVLQSMAVAGPAIGYSEASPTTGVKGALLVPVPSRIGTLYVKANTTGTAGQTDFDVNVNGSQVAQASIANTEADGTFKGVAVDVDVEAGDLVELEITAAATAAADISASVYLQPVTVEP